MGREQFAAGGGDFDSNFIVRRNQRIPGRGQIGLTSRRQDQAIHHRADRARICFVIHDRVSVVRGVDSRLQGRRTLRAIALAMAQKKTRATFRNDKALILWSLTGITLRHFAPRNKIGRNRPAPSVTFTFTSRSAHEFVRIARFTRNCSTAPRRRGSAKRSCANWNYTRENKTPQRMIDHSLHNLFRRRNADCTDHCATGLFAGRFSRGLDLSELDEWTMEANPGSVSPAKAALLHQLGITRISLGVQSWDDDLFKLLGREHNAEQARQSFEIFRRAGFSNINVDLMFGLPGQTSINGVKRWSERSRSSRNISRLTA